MKLLSTASAARARKKRSKGYGGFILSFEQGRAETIDALLRFRAREATTALSSKDWKLERRELVALSLLEHFPGIDGLALMERSGGNAVTAAWRMRIHSPVMFEEPVTFDRLPRKFRSARLHSSTISLNRLQASDWNELLHQLSVLRPALSGAIADLVKARSVDRRLFATTPREQRLLEERDAIGLTVDIAGLDRAALLKSVNIEAVSQANSVLDVLGLEPLQEQDALRHDQQVFGELLQAGMRHVRLAGPRGTEVRIHVYDKKPLETVAGIDLLIYQELYDSFILVQYKMMKRTRSETGGWSYTVDAHARAQLAAMNAVATRSHHVSPAAVTDWRLSDEIFFWKFCETTRMSDSESSLIHGITMSRPHFQHFLSLPESRSKRGGQVVGYANCNRYFTNSQFVELASDGWIGGGRGSSALIQKLLQANQAGGRRALLAAIHPGDAFERRQRGWKTG